MMMMEEEESGNFYDLMEDNPTAVVGWVSSLQDQLLELKDVMETTTRRNIQAFLDQFKTQILPAATNFIFPEHPFISLQVGSYMFLLSCELTFVHFIFVWLLLLLIYKNKCLKTTSSSSSSF